MNSLSVAIFYLSIIHSELELHRVEIASLENLSKKLTIASDYWIKNEWV